MTKRPNLSRTRRRKTTASWRNQRGVSLFEYAMVFLIFLSLVFGISGFGHALFVYHQLDHAAKEATRYSTVRGATCATDNKTGGSCTAANSASGTAGPTTTADVTAYIDSLTPPSIDYTNFTITPCGVQGSTMCAGSATVSKALNCDPGSGGLINNPGCVVSITISYPYTVVFPIFGAVGNFTMSSTSEMIIVH